ncbi:MAG: DUF167 domain-containing protein [Gallionellaceae bacterium]|nr:DUF167 domain-containing protein [Gallionellaceae bacterium]
MSRPAWLAAGAAGGSEITLHVQPGASRSELAGLHGDALKLRIAARPVEGAANAAVLDFLATWLGVPRRELRLLRGDKSRRKTVWVPLPPEQVAVA